MYRITLWLVALILLAGCASYHKVYICKSGEAYVYHKNRKCIWLKRCARPIGKVKLGEATGTYHRRPCKPCYKL